MAVRYLSILAAALAILLFAGQAALAADKTHEGKVVKAAEGKLTMTDKEGKEHTHPVAADAKITCDGKDCKLEDLKAGYRVKVTTKDDSNTAIRIEAQSKDK